MRNIVSQLLNLITVIAVTNADFFMNGYDCQNADFVANLSTRMDLEEKNEDVTVIKAKAQIIQDVADTDRVTLHEITIERSLFVEQCGSANNYWRWYHEVMTNFELSVPIPLSDKEIASAIRTKTLKLGSEIDQTRGELFRFSPGKQTFKTMIYGEMKVNPDVNGGYLMCTGEDYRTGKKIWKNSLVTAGYAENGLVDLDYNDGECMIFGVKSYCYNPYLGTNYMVVKERQGATENCSYLPTRKTVIDGQIITHQDGVHNAFLSHDYKVVLKLTEKVSVCACEETWKTNYDSLLDYSAYKSENISRYFYNVLFDDIEKTLQTSLKDFFLTASRSDIGLFTINPPFFGLMRGMILSVLRCEEKNLKLTEGNKVCTKQIQAFDLETEERVYVDPSTSIIQDTMEEEECLEMSGVGDVYYVRRTEDMSVASRIPVIQEKDIELFHGVTGSVSSNSELFIQKVKLDSIWAYTSHQKAGVYSSEYIEARNRYLRRPAVYRAMDRSMANTWSNPNKPMYDISNGEGDYFDYANPQAIMEVVFGHPVVRFIIGFFQVLGGISGACFVVNQMKRCKPCVPKIDINLNGPVDKATKVREDILDWEKALNEDITVEKRELTEKAGDEPPPYTVFE